MLSSRRSRGCHHLRGKELDFSLPGYTTFCGMAQAVHHRLPSTQQFNLSRIQRCREIDPQTPSITPRFVDFTTWQSTSLSRIYSM